MALKSLDALDMEFQYYSCLVKDLVGMLPTRCEQMMASVWFRKLSDASYNVEALREKRNHYLLMLTICLTLNGLRYPFDKYPSEDALEDTANIRDPQKMAPYNMRCPLGVTEQEQITEPCDLHKAQCPPDIHNIGKVLDETFKFLLRISEPYVPKLSDPSDRRRGRQWITFLSSIDSKCFHMKGVRNDYAMLLAGYLINDELPGPFSRSPIAKLIPLENLVKIEDMNNKMIIDPSHPKTLKFFRDVPHPEDGAFAFIAVSGEICDGFTKRK